MTTNACVVPLMLGLLCAIGPAAGSLARNDFATLPGQTPAAQAGRAASRERPFVWQSVSASPDVIPRDVTHLYLVLLQAKRLEVQSYFDAEGHNIETILRQKQLIFGAFF